MPDSRSTADPLAGYEAEIEALARALARVLSDWYVDQQRLAAPTAEPPDRVAPTPPPPLLTAGDVAERLRISRSRADELLRSGGLPSLAIGRSRRVRAEDLESWIRRRAGAALKPG
jgi:excisionase family DNA binding protein